MTQAFYRKWRPQIWDEVIAQDHVVQTLRNAVRTGRTAHAYLLAGPRGTGKTTTARLLAKALNCIDPSPANRPCDHCEICTAINEGRFLDLIEIDAASNTSVDDVRDLRDKINFRPSQGQYKVYIIDEVHMLSTAAFNALLKTLEEPPPHAVFILATTEVHKIPATILSRVQRYEFRRIPVTEIANHLRKKAAEEGLAVDDDALLLIARQATGAMRDAISLLDQLASTGERVTLQEAQQVLGTATSQLVLKIVDAVLSQDAGAGLEVIRAALDSGTDARQFARQVVDYLRSVLLVRMGSGDSVDVTADQRKTIAEHAQQFAPQQLVETIRLFNAATADTRSGWHPGLAIELALVQAASPQTPIPEPVQAARPVSSSVVHTPAPAVVETPQAKQPPEAPREEVYAKPARPVPQPVETPQPTRSRPAQQPAAAQEPAQSAPAPEGNKVVTQQDLQQNWQRIRLMVKRRSVMTEGLLNSCRYTLKDPKTLILSFQTPVVKSKMETEENIDMLRQAIQSILGAQLTIRCILGEKGAQTDTDIDRDSIVGTALDLGGKIVYEE